MEGRFILIVEPDSVVRAMLKDVLEKEYHVFEASGYQEAVRQLKRRIHLALINRLLPDGDGIALAHEIGRTNPGLPVVVVGFSCPGDMEKEGSGEKKSDFKKREPGLICFLQTISEIVTGKGDKGVVEFSFPAASRKEFLMDCMALHLENNYMKDLTLDKLARMTGINRFAFSRSFKERFGQGCISYLNSIRMRKGAELLRDSDLHITHIAFRVGYESLSQFERTFKKAHGSSPKEYRRGLKKT